MMPTITTLLLHPDDAAKIPKGDEEVGNEKLPFFGADITGVRLISSEHAVKAEAANCIVILPDGFAFFSKEKPNGVTP